MLKPKLLPGQFGHLDDKLLCRLDFRHHIILCQAELVIVIACQTHVEQAVKKSPHFWREYSCLYKMLSELPDETISRLFSSVSPSNRSARAAISQICRHFYV